MQVFKSQWKCDIISEKIEFQNEGFDRWLSDDNEITKKIIYIVVLLFVITSYHLVLHLIHSVFTLEWFHRILIKLSSIEEIVENKPRAETYSNIYWIPETWGKRYNTGIHKNFKTSISCLDELTLILWIIGSMFPNISFIFYSFIHSQRSITGNLIPSIVSTTWS